MGFIAWILLGLGAGAIARKIAPGHIEGGWFATLILGIAGAVVGGYLSSWMFNINTTDSFFQISTWLFAVIGGVIVSYIYSFFKGKSNSTSA